MKLLSSLAALATATALMGSAASAVTLEVTITNNQAADGLFLTPLYVGFHNGSFDAFDVGSGASAGVERLAEEGDASVLASERTAAAPTSQGGVVTGPEGFGSVAGQPPVLDAGETATLRITVDASNRYLTFLSMVIPSNDAFIGNDNPFAYEIFDAMGAFTGIGPIEVTLGDIWDAGTEVNNGIGAAFNTAGGTGTDEGGTISLFGDPSSLFGQSTAAGTTTGSAFGNSLATISVAAVPVPAALPLMATALGLFGFAGMRRTRRT